MDKLKYQKSKYKSSVEEVVRACQALRQDQENPVDISFAEFVQGRWGVSMEGFYDDLGLNASIDTIKNIFTLPDVSVRWLIPELFRDALRLGLRRNPIWQDMIAAEQTIANPSITIPSLNMSDAAPRYVGEGETISTGTISYGQKTLKIRKMGKGIQIPYEVQQYVSLNVIGIFLQDFGIKLNQGIDSLMIDCLINGEQSDGSESAPVVGVASAGSMVYKDLLTVWVRMSRIGRLPQSIIGGEGAAIDTLNLAEFKLRVFGPQTEKKLNLKTPVPEVTNYYIHGAVPVNQQIIVDANAALIKFNAQPLLVEDEKIVSSQKLSSYATLTTGFGILYRDGRIVIDSSLAFAGHGFPSYMDVDTAEKVTIQ